jgi:hypothetical protein
MDSQTANNAQQPVAQEDPLKKLMSLVQGEGGQVDPIKVKRAIVVVKNKVSNWALRTLVESYIKDGVDPETIVKQLLWLDENAENDVIDEDYFYKLAGKDK